MPSISEAQFTMVSASAMLTILVTILTLALATVLVHAIPGSHALNLGCLGQWQQCPLSFLAYREEHI